MNIEVAKQPFVLKMSVMDAAIILGNLILALKHPDNSGHSAAIARQICKDIFDTLVIANFYDPESESAVLDELKSLKIL